MYAEWRRGCGVRCVHVWRRECMRSGGGGVRCVHVWRVSVCGVEGVWYQMCACVEMCVCVCVSATTTQQFCGLAR